MTVDLTPDELVIIRSALDWRLDRYTQFAHECEELIGPPARPTDDPDHWHRKADALRAIIVKLQVASVILK